MARRFPLPSSSGRKRFGFVTLAAAGGLAITGAVAATGAVSVAGAVPAAAAALPRPAAAHGPARTGSVRTAPARTARVADEFGLTRLSLRDAGAKSSGAKPAVAKPTAARTRPARTAAVRARSVSRPGAALGSAGSPGSPQSIAQAMLGQFGWSASQFSCLDPLWMRESNWSVTASNPGSGAYGIAQALPGSKMSSAGADWQTDAATQIRWGLQYIQGTYGSPCAAWDHEEADDWY